MLTNSDKDKHQEAYKSFSEIFNRLIVPPDDNDLVGLHNALLSVKLSDFLYINSQISYLKKLLQRIKTIQVEDPFICIFRAHCYTVGFIAVGKNQHLEIAEDYTVRAINGFNSELFEYGVINDYNKAISHWYLGTLYFYYYELEDHRSEMGKAFELLAGLKDGYRGMRPFDDFYIELNKLLVELKPLCEQPQPPTYPEFLEWEKENKSIDARKTSHHHLEETSVIEEEFELIDEDSDSQEEELAKSGENIELEETKDNIETKYIHPCFPIYSNATIGLNGEAVLPDPLNLKCAGGIDDAGRVVIQEREYEVYFAKGNDSKLTAKGENDFGWLQVIGNSMDCAIPVPIRDQDYVLFFKNRDLTSCIGNIIVASQAETGAQKLRLTVKRLVQKDGNLHLQSESLMKSYKFIEIVKENQIVGQVVAVAKVI